MSDRTLGFHCENWMSGGTREGERKRDEQEDLRRGESTRGPDSDGGLNARVGSAGCEGTVGTSRCGPGTTVEISSQFGFITSMRWGRTRCRTVGGDCQSSGEERGEEWDSQSSS